MVSSSLHRREALFTLECQSGQSQKLYDLVRHNRRQHFFLKEFRNSSLSEVQIFTPSLCRVTEIDTLQALFVPDRKSLTNLNPTDSSKVGSVGVNLKAGPASRQTLLA